MRPRAHIWSGISYGTSVQWPIYATWDWSDSADREFSAWVAL